MEAAQLALEAQRATYRRRCALVMIDVIEGRTRISCPLVLHAGEVPLFVAADAGLFEPRSGGGHYQGASAGFSVPVGHHGVRARVGQSRGTFVRDGNRPTVIDHGTATITDQRMVFAGPMRVTEWAWSKLVGVVHDPDRPMTAVQVSNRQKVSGVVYEAEDPPTVRLALEVAVAISRDQAAVMVEHLRDLAAA